VRQQPDAGEASTPSLEGLVPGGPLNEMRTLPIMPFVAGALLIASVLPIRLTPRSLGRLAFGLWLLGGVVLLSLGTARLLQGARGEATPWVVAGLALAALGVGVAKGWFILRRTARRNIDRLAALTEGRRPIHVFGVWSWMVIGLMTALSVGLTLGGVPPLWRGMVDVAIGAALVASSLNYIVPLRTGKLRSVSVG
jgi:hypothetical protein